MSSVTTGRGDQGVTSSRDFHALRKSSTRPEAVGSMDELSCFIGVLRQENHLPEGFSSQLLEVQRNLYRMNAELATVDPKNLASLQLLGPGDVKRIEQWIQILEKQVEPPQVFLLPGGGNLASARADLCRAVCRRTERAVVALYHECPTPDGDNSLLVYLNRLSDWFFLVALKLGSQRDPALTPKNL